MKQTSIRLVIIFLFIPILFTSCQKKVTNIERPEKIVSKRQIVYDKETYSELADRWKTYNSEFPSEDAYANWMYAARYAGWENYESLLETGVNKYPANPTLLYLKAFTKQGKEHNSESTELLKKAVELDPAFIDPWFGLAVDYMEISEVEKSKNALKKLLEENAISDEIMDYNYNVLSLLEQNAILITNGDNDTYPVWILTKSLNYRPDVVVVNRSLLNTDWYPTYIINEEGVPEFISSSELENLREDILTKIKSGSLSMPSAGPFSDTLITEIISSARQNDRPVYLASTLYQTDVIKQYLDSGIKLGLVTLLNPEKKERSTLIKNQLDVWLNKFRTQGLTNWSIKYGKKYASGKWLTVNYAAAITELIIPTKKNYPGKVLPLFNWYKNNILDLLPENVADEINLEWCKHTDIQEINSWCKDK